MSSEDPQGTLPAGYGTTASGAPPQQPPSPPPPKKTLVWVFVLIGGVFFVIALIGALAALGARGASQYIANSKQVEARSALAQIGSSAVRVFETAEPDPVLCPSARAPVPASIVQVKGKKYTSTSEEWSRDPGFSCLGFAFTQPQHYQYDFKSSATGFTAIARGDLDGNGVESSFELSAEVRDQELVFSPELVEVNPTE